MSRRGSRDKSYKHIPPARVAVPRPASWVCCGPAKSSESRASFRLSLLTPSLRVGTEYIRYHSTLTARLTLTLHRQNPGPWFRRACIASRRLRLQDSLAAELFRAPWSYHSVPSSACASCARIRLRPPAVEFLTLNRSMVVGHLFCF